MPPRRSLAFCRALHKEIGDDPRRWTTITAVADRLGIDQDKAEELAAELDAAHLVRVGGGHSVMLTEAGGSYSEARPRPVGLELERARGLLGLEDPELLWPGAAGQTLQLLLQVPQFLHVALAAA
jgi:hypothetical protein